jgi:hypothetical protein
VAGALGDTYLNGLGIKTVRRDERRRLLGTRARHISAAARARERIDDDGDMVWHGT